jgi:glycosyltransferase involved in cell wall biosynthesis
VIVEVRMEGDPEITVVVVAHDRSDFVEEALASVAAQDIDPMLFEVVLCTNLPRGDLGANLGRVRWVRLDLGPGNWGEWVRAALPRCRGEILCFLDDDDRFEPRKLTSLHSVFRAHPSVGYYHNRVQRFVDGSASAGYPSTPRRPPEGPVCGLVEDHGKSRRLVDRLFWNEGGFNASAMAVRREVLESLGPVVSELEVGHSLALFYAAALGPWDLFFDPLPLTDYRVHSANSSVPSGSDLRREYYGAVEHGGPVIRDAARIARFIETHREGRFSSAPVRSVGMRTRLLRTLGSPDVSRRQLFRQVAEYLSLTPVRLASNQRGMLAMAALGLLLPRLPDAWLRGQAPSPG